ncbi:MAG: CHAD domain-containing protein [Acidobacteria bacterium]|nr:CHAD domain-containing protein [Acidobacteriota bacterium]
MSRLHLPLSGDKAASVPTTSLLRREPPLSAAASFVQAVGWDAVQRLARRHVKRFTVLQSRVLKGNNPEAIHDFRVTSRRLQQLLDLMYPKPRPKRIRKLRRMIQRSRRLFSRTRNCDVLILRVDSYLAGKKTTHRESWAQFKRYLEQQRSKSFEKAVAKLDELNRPDLRAGLRNAISSPQARVFQQSSANGSRPGKNLQDGSFHSRFNAELESLWKVFSGYVVKSKTESKPGALHRVRIAGKRLRYLLEVIADSGVPQTPRMLATLRGVHQTLGDWQDLEVMEAMISEMLQQPKLPASNTSSPGEIKQLLRRTGRLKQECAANYYSAIESPGWSEMQIWISSLLTKQPPAQVKHQIRTRVLKRAN